MLREDLWDKCVERLEAEIPDKEIGTWIRPLRAVLAVDQVTLLAPNRIVMERVRNEFLPRIQRAISGLAAFDVTVNVAVGSGAEPRVSTPAAAAGTGEDFAPMVKGRLDPRYTLQTFIEGKSNSQARAAGATSTTRC
jgi:chromosomal replication initiator protein